MTRSYVNVRAVATRGDVDAMSARRDVGTSAIADRRSVTTRMGVKQVYCDGVGTDYMWSLYP